MFNRKTMLWIVGIFIIAMMFMQGGLRQPADTGTIQPQVVAFEEIRTTMQADPSLVEQLVFVKNKEGQVQEVLLRFKDHEKAPLSAQVPGEAGSARLLELSEDLKIPADAQAFKEKPVTFTDVLLGLVINLLPWVLIFMVIMWIMGRAARNQMGMGSQIGASKASKFVPSADKKTFADVAGVEEAKEELMEVVRYLRNPGLLQYLGGKPPKGVLLIGDPGNGKTLLAKAVAGEANATFFSISASQFVEMFVGVGAARVRDLFNQARANKPAIVFIDEIDAVGRQRGAGIGGGHDEREQTLNQLLVEMDGFVANDSIVLMAATNRPDVLDPALVRPGRFDLQVLVDAPDKHGREQILKIHSRNKKLAPEVDLDVIAANTPGFSGAQLEGVTDQAALVAARRIEKEINRLRNEGKLSEKEINAQVPRLITMEDMDEGIDRVQMGPAKEKAAKRMSDEDMDNTAYHELGHAWISQVMYERKQGGDPVTKITIVPRARALGYTQALPMGDRYNYTDKQLRARIMMAMGGRAAQEIFLDTIDTGASNDFKQAQRWAYRMVTEFGMSALGPISVGEGGPNPFLGRELAGHNNIGPELTNLIDQEWMKIVRECYEETKKILEADAECIRKIARVLREKETILGPEFKKLRDESKCAIKPCNKGDDCADDEAAAE
ncbi:MAG: ATP-dependent zinc metalloprotease FtsH [Candidatus Melainabacteria bacterium]|nr:ATP-dependent zinc metalloprotease FtsH [Candidatus Melainabacteria bacterium]